MWAWFQRSSVAMAWALWKNANSWPKDLLSRTHVGQHLKVSTFEEGFEITLGVVSLQAPKKV
jgi:hypothetical protein